MIELKQGNIITEDLTGRRYYLVNSVTEAGIEVIELPMKPGAITRPFLWEGEYFKIADVTSDPNHKSNQ